MSKMDLRKNEEVDTDLNKVDIQGIYVDEDARMQTIVPISFDKETATAWRIYGIQYAGPDHDIYWVGIAHYAKNYLQFKIEDGMENAKITSSASSSSSNSSILRDQKDQKDATNPIHSINNENVFKDILVAKNQIIWRGGTWSKLIYSETQRNLMMQNRMYIPASVIALQFCSISILHLLEILRTCIQRIQTIRFFPIDLMVTHMLCPC